MYITKSSTLPDGNTVWVSGFYNAFQLWVPIPPEFRDARKAEAHTKKLCDAIKWVAVTDRLPRCNKAPNSAGVPVFIKCMYKGVRMRGCMFYGKLHSGNIASFYILGETFSGVTHWAHQPYPVRFDCPDVHQSVQNL